MGKILYNSLFYHFAAHLEGTRGTLLCPGTVVENHCHRCTQIKNSREGVPDVFDNFLGGQGFQEKCIGGSPFLGFYCIFINKCFEICLEGSYIYLPRGGAAPPAAGGGGGGGGGRRDR